MRTNAAAGAMNELLEAVPDGLVILLAILGAMALVVRLFRSLARWALRAAEVVAASAAVEASARRGDLTGLADAREAERAARSAKRQAGLMAGLWFLSVSIPFAVSSLSAYALAAPLWLLPKNR